MLLANLFDAQQNSYHIVPVQRSTISEYFTIQYNPLFRKTGATHTTTVTGEAKTDFRETFLFIANPLFAQ
jgi:hypothetical protein